MIDRRDLLLGVGCVAALGMAEWLKPRHVRRLLPPGTSLPSIVPSRVSGWQVGSGGDIVIPRTSGTLASRLYSDELARNYEATASGSIEPPVMLLIAYGSSQSDSLQLHRPEVCYPATGFEVTALAPDDIALAPGRVVPAVRLTATLQDRIEDIIYWTRLGESLPRNESEQRRARFNAALAGTLEDGVLVRASSIRSDSSRNRFAEIHQFLELLLRDSSPLGRQALLGSQFSRL